jgi:23S rRNA pseudouridine1911/1915/1917 synthase
LNVTSVNPAIGTIPPPRPPRVEPGQLREWVIFEDEHLLALDKPGWLVVHPSKDGPWSSLAGAVREEFGYETIRFVYRLDRETSGVILLAKTEAMGRRLQKISGQKRIGKVYAAILDGELAERVVVEQALGPDAAANVAVKQRVVTAGEAGAQGAVTVFHSLIVREGRTLAGVELRTGRKHQIRAHAEWLGKRVTGDKLYGPDPGLYLEFAGKGWTERHARLLPLTRQALHCLAIDLRATGTGGVLRAPWPADLARFAEAAMRLPPAEAQATLDAFAASVFSASFRP